MSQIPQPKYPSKSARGRSISYNQYNMHDKSKWLLEKKCITIGLVLCAGCPCTWEDVPGSVALGAHRARVLAPHLSSPCAGLVPHPTSPSQASSIPDLTAPGAGSSLDITEPRVSCALTSLSGSGGGCIHLPCLVPWQMSS